LTLLPDGLNIPVFGDMLGKNLSHYRIVEQIGAGGMGVVFLPTTSNWNAMLP
jgi:hypothetical protein